MPHDLGPAASTADTTTTPTQPAHEPSSPDHEPPPDQTLPESRVLVIMTGGTICMRPSAAGLVPARGFLDAALRPSPTFNDGSDPAPVDVVVDSAGTREQHATLRTAAGDSSAAGSVRFAVLEFAELVDSSSISADGWAQIARTVSWNYTRFDGFVVLHGTDSLAYTAAALSFMFDALGKPVVLTGAQAPMLALQSDAAANLLGALVVAGRFAIPEVSLYFNSTLFRGTRATKVAACDFAAFASPNCAPLAVTTALGTRVRWDLVQRPTSLRHCSVQTLLDTSHVACLRIFPGIQPAMVDAVLRLPGLRGLVLETFGAGNAPGGPDDALTKALAAAIRRGLVIVSVTQCLSGSVSPVYAPGMTLSRAGVVAGLDMTSEAALTKLAFLLGRPDASPAAVARDMAVALRGELTEPPPLPLFRHPDASASANALPDRLATLAALGYAIAHGDEPRVADILRLAHDWILDDADYSGNTPVHLAATADNSSLLRLCLQRGGSVHRRNLAGRTPLFLAANAGMAEHVRLLRAAGAHLHADEMGVAELHARRRPAVWALAGVKADGEEEVDKKER
ncbi:hypothetical protein LOZ57_000780 [Ophidiomyces ophidiicola]|uniref:uncharacterized protein n=1 Tax=Ophidiomyces ophidiicola TaxID=1387563 RepID=UPI0020C537EE|nr:uncharacterized protein LOZ57_000780 [Ophidiomyces ophidiicola]KAI1952700.1 hypothetical protein LOZ57_000780 [Ophidiomyces ophidiicola]